MCLRNGVHWVASDMAALGMRLVVVPLYVDDNAGNIAWCARDAGCRLVVLENQRVRRVLAEAAIPGCTLVVLNGEPAQDAAGQRFDERPEWRSA